MPIEERDSSGRILKSALSGDRARELARLSAEARRRKRQQKADGLAASVLALLPPMQGEAAVLREQIVRRSCEVAQGESRAALQALARLDRMTKPSGKLVDGWGGHKDWIPTEPEPEPEAPSSAPPPSSADKPRAPINPCAEYLVKPGQPLPTIRLGGAPFFSRK